MCASGVGGNSSFRKEEGPSCKIDREGNQPWNKKETEANRIECNYGPVKTAQRLSATLGLQ